MTAYMAGLAEKNRKIRHTAAERHFFRGELQEFFAKLRSDVHFPCLIQEGYDVSYGGSANNPVKRRSTSFIVADCYDQNKDYGEIQDKMDGCETLADEIFSRMLWDAENTDGCPFHSIEVEAADGTFLQNEQMRYVGYRITFTVSDAACLANKNDWDE